MDKVKSKTAIRAEIKRLSVDLAAFRAAKYMSSAPAPPNYDEISTNIASKIDALRWVLGQIDQL